MRWLYLFVTIIILCSVQFIALSAGKAGLGVAPDLLLIFAVFLALNARRDVALVGSWLAGLFSEVSAGHQRIGMLAFLLTFFAWVLSRRRSEMFTEHWLTRTLIVALVGLTCGLGTIATVYLETREFVNWEGCRQMLFDVGATTILSIPLLVLFARIKRLYTDNPS